MTTEGTQVAPDEIPYYGDPHAEYCPHCGSIDYGLMGASAAWPIGVCLDCGFDTDHGPAAGGVS